MVAKLCISHQHKLVDVCSSRNIGGYTCIDNNEFPGNQSSHSKPGKEFENGITGCLIFN